MSRRDFQHNTREREREWKDVPSKASGIHLSLWVYKSLHFGIDTSFQACSKPTKTQSWFAKTFYFISFCVMIVQCPCKCGGCVKLREIDQVCLSRKVDFWETAVTCFIQWKFLREFQHVAAANIWTSRLIYASRNSQEIPIALIDENDSQWAPGSTLC